jgi:hypothetical protein
LTLRNLCGTLLEVENTNEKSMANGLHSSGNSLLVGSVVGGALTTADAMAIIANAGYGIRFTDGAWSVTCFEGCTQRMTRREVIQLARDLKYIG